MLGAKTSFPEKCRPSLLFFNHLISRITNFNVLLNLAVNGDILVKGCFYIGLFLHLTFLFLVGFPRNFAQIFKRYEEIF